MDGQKEGGAMDGLLFRTRVAVLWVAVAVALVGSVALFVYEAGALEEMLAGEAEGEPLDDTARFSLTALVMLPLLMAGVTLLVGDRVNRYVNVIVGLALGLFGVYAVGSELLAGHLHWHVWPTALATAFAFLIAGLGVVGLRQSSSQQSRPREDATA
jgi:hypothetical protein